MNRIILIGNGFDLAHNLPTRYDQFINWYWDEWFLKLGDCHSRKICDKLCEYKIADYDWSKSVAEIDQQLYAKYGLDESEIAFIESKIKPME